jgi:hypothetical protein
MRYLRSVVPAVIAAAALFAPSSALAQIESLSARTGTLSPEGDSVTVTLAFQCRTAWNVAFGDVSVAQSHGNRLTRGSGDFFNPFPGVPCTGARETQDILVNDTTEIPFKQGKASVRADLTVFNPTTFRLVTESVGPAVVQLRKK